MTNILVIFSDDQPDALATYMPFLRNNFPRRFSVARPNVAVCAASRVGVLTGQYSKDNTFEGNDVTGFSYDTDIAKWFNDAGYYCGHIGKTPQPLTEIHPAPAGYDFWREFTTPGDAFPPVDDGTSETSPGIFRDDLIVDYVEAFLAAATTDPWFLIVAPGSPHIPYAPNPADLHGYPQVFWPMAAEADVSDKPSWIQALSALPAASVPYWQRQARRLIRDTRSLDRTIENIFTTIADVLDDTVVIYASDNGVLMGEHRLGLAGFFFSFKNMAYEAAMRVPLFARGPGFTAGTSTVPCVLQDITATVCAIADVTPGLTDQAGVDLRDVQNNPGTYSTRETLHAGNGSDGSVSPAFDAICTATRKLVRYRDETETDEYEMYDLDTDPDELDNVANDAGRLTERNTLEAALDVLLA